VPASTINSDSKVVVAQEFTLQQNVKDVDMRQASAA